MGSRGNVASSALAGHGHDRGNSLSSMIVMVNRDPKATEPEIGLGPLPGLIGYALRRAQLAVFLDFHQTMAEADIRTAQYSVLEVLRHNPGLRQTQVSAALGIKTTNFVPLFDALEKRGLAERRAIAGDRRARGLFLTQCGHDLLTRLETLVAAH